MTQCSWAEKVQGGHYPVPPCRHHLGLWCCFSVALCEPETITGQPLSRVASMSPHTCVPHRTSSVEAACGAE